ncbi:MULTISPECIES: hypothetical protein [unclassified Vibrio]|uniref:hypothetical protein n=1 Tax=unclassified Vibrio TaxID=2614977 RepID=UPI000C82CFFF|nr:MULTISPECIES: hypothetical protein [unclassified Vibrio]PMI18653.1 hypothetical protein BCU50_21285 [Vibrio sp. 10N.286.46.E10]PMI98563.1 hypothetical protein BCU34_16670 [Vibrio sp. 10N.286.45.E10]PTP01780.1 hypothetical protein CWO17_15345 [Vibrio sp. 10N.286.45.A3]PTQ22782.1 hypothetical protein CWO24_16845 [Vibrio sp. 10N.286.46.E10]TKE78176.1 hypothetical protein FCV56_17990 [Vibrio sp. F12]
MKKSMITIGLLMGGFTATAAWAIDSVATAPVQGHKPTVSVPVVTTTDIVWTPADIEVEFDAPTTLEDQDGDAITKVTYWLEDASGTEYAKVDEADISELNKGVITFSNFNELKNKQLNLVWQVHTQYGYPSTTLVSNEMTSNNFTVGAKTALTISGTAEVGQTLTVHADDGVVVDLAIADVTFTLTENETDTAGLYPKGDAEAALQAAITEVGDDLTFVLPKEAQGYTITASMNEASITRASLR